jgi:hypothetical protein
MKRQMDHLKSLLRLETAMSLSYKDSEEEDDDLKLDFEGHSEQVCSSKDSSPRTVHELTEAKRHVIAA